MQARHNLVVPLRLMIYKLVIYSNVMSLMHHKTCFDPCWSRQLRSSINFIIVTLLCNDVSFNQLANYLLSDIY
jgi:hypothetical protein